MQNDTVQEISAQGARLDVLFAQTDHLQLKERTVAGTSALELDGEY